MAKKSGKKVRVAFRKNREQRKRHGDLTRDAQDEGLLADELPTDERLSGKGALSRHRTIIGVESETGDQLLREVDLSSCLPGRVLRSIGLNCTVESDDGTHYECTVRRVLRTMQRDARNAVVAGDRVFFLPDGPAHGVVERVEPRRGVLSRGSRRYEHVIVSNVDQVLIVVTAADPPLKPSLIDRFLISAEKGQVDAIICINKIDLVDPVDLQPVVGIYAQLGYDVVLTSTVTGQGMDRLRSLLANRETVFSGQSGVGKSTLLNQIHPGWGLRTATMSADSRKGRHTTRTTTLMELECGGWVVDTPGIRQLALWDVIPEEVEGFFVEFHALVAGCKFPDCSHTHETGCGVQQAVASGLMSPMRYESYLRIVEGD